MIIYCACTFCHHNYNSPENGLPCCGVSDKEREKPDFVDSTGFCARYLKQLDDTDFSKVSSQDLLMMIHGGMALVETPLNIFQKISQEYQKRASLKI